MRHPVSSFPGSMVCVILTEWHLIECVYACHDFVCLEVAEVEWQVADAKAQRSNSKFCKDEILLNTNDTHT